MTLINKTLSKMKGLRIAAVVACLIAVSTVSDALAIGFEVDTPLDPFLGGLSKMKRQIVRRVKELSNDDSFVNSNPIEQLNMLFAQPPPVTLPQFGYQAQTSQQPMTTQLQPATIDQRKMGLNQIPAPIVQAMDAQLMSFLNQGMGKRVQFPYQSVPGLRQLPGMMQQLTQALPFPAYNQLPLAQTQKNKFF